jgi:hypothetical protein
VEYTGQYACFTCIGYFDALLFGTASGLQGAIRKRQSEAGQAKPARQISGRFGSIPLPRR